MRNKASMEVWITKYALTQGIFKLHVIDAGNDVVRSADNALEIFHKEGRDWHITKESAIARAEEMRQKKIASLARQITKLEKMDFEGMCK